MTRLAIIAGQGNLPLQVAQGAYEQGLGVVVFPIEGQGDAVFESFCVRPSRLMLHLTLATTPSSFARIDRSNFKGTCLPSGPTCMVWLVFPMMTLFSVTLLPTRGAPVDSSAE